MFCVCMNAFASCSEDYVVLIMLTAKHYVPILFNFEACPPPPPPHTHTHAHPTTLTTPRPTHPHPTHLRT